MASSLNKGLVFHGTFNDSDTDNGVLRDKSAYDNHGVINGGVTTGQNGIVGEYVMTTQTETTISTAGTFVPIEGPGSIDPDSERLVGTANNGELEYRGRSNTTAAINLASSASGIDNNATYAIGIGKKRYSG